MQSAVLGFTRFSVLSVSTVILIACDRPKPSEEESAPKAAIELYDTDEDGVLSEVEKASMNQKFVERFDSDGDGKIGSKERVDARKQSQTSIAVTKRTADSNAIAVAFIVRMDQNKDNFISADEVDEKRWSVISRADRNGDDKVDSQEWLAGARR